MSRTHLLKHCFFSCKATVQPKPNLQQRYNTETTADIVIIHCQLMLLSTTLTIMKLSLVVAMFLTFVVIASVLTITKALLTTHHCEVERESNAISNHMIISFSYWSQSSSIGMISMMKLIVVRVRGIVIVLNAIEFGKEGCQTLNRQVFAGTILLQCENGESTRFYVVFEVDIAMAILYSLFKYFCNQLKKINQVILKYNRVFWLFIGMSPIFMSHLLLYFFSNDKNILKLYFCDVLNGIACGGSLTF